MNRNKSNRDNYGNSKNLREATDHRDWNGSSKNKGNVGQRQVKVKTHHGSMKKRAGKKNSRIPNGVTLSGATITAVSGDINPGNYTKGVLLTKVHKSASSTMSGITIQILLRNKCGEGNFYHQEGKNYGKRDKAKSFMFSPIRDPASRAISFINYRMVSLRAMEPTDENVLEILNGTPYTTGRGGSSLPYISMNPLPQRSMWIKNHPAQVLNTSLVELNVKNAIQDYDFFVVVERMDESLVALALVMGIDVADVVTIGDAKVAGSGYDYFVKRKCTPLKKLVHNEGRIAEFLDSDQWRAMNYGDYLLHATANHSLDMTIASLGGEYARAFSRYMELKSLAEKTCAPSVKMPCDEDGKLRKENDCFLRDYGCGYRCMYNLANNFTHTKGDDDV